MNMKKTGWALLVGVNHYYDEAISNLHVCADDVQAVYDVLTIRDYKRQHVKLLLSPFGDESTQANRVDILAALKALADAADEHDLVLFYFSGHGIAEHNDAYILPADTHYTVISDTAISLKRIKQILHSSKAQAKVIMLDACHSGAQIGKAPPEMTTEFMQHVFEEAEGIAILSSCKHQQVSWEWHAKQQSVFTHFLLQGLQGAADFEGKGVITVSDIHRYVTDSVKRWAVQHNRVQTPTLQYTAVGDIALIHVSEPVESILSEHLENSGYSGTIDKSNHKHAGEASTMKKTETDLLEALYQEYRKKPGDWVNSEKMRSLLNIEPEQMHDFVLALHGKKLLETNYLGDRALLKITAEGVAILQDA